MADMISRMFQSFNVENAHDQQFFIVNLMDQEGVIKSFEHHFFWWLRQCK